MGSGNAAERSDTEGLGQDIATLRAAIRVAKAHKREVLGFAIFNLLKDLKIQNALKEGDAILDQPR